MGLVLPGRCALLDWLLKPLNLLQPKCSTKIDGNNQYVSAASITPTKLSTSYLSVLILFSSILFCNLPFSCFLSSPSPLLPPQAEQASLSHVLELLSVVLLLAIWAMCPTDSLSMLGHWIQDKLGEVRHYYSLFKNVYVLVLSKHGGFEKCGHYVRKACINLVVFSHLHRNCRPLCLLAAVQSPLQSEAGGRGRSSRIAAGC